MVATDAPAALGPHAALAGSLVGLGGGLFALQVPGPLPSTAPVRPGPSPWAVATRKGQEQEPLLVVEPEPEPGPESLLVVAPEPEAAVTAALEPSPEPEPKTAPEPVAAEQPPLQPEASHGAPRGGAATPEAQDALGDGLPVPRLAALADTGVSPDGTWVPGPALGGDLWSAGPADRAASASPTGPDRPTSPGAATGGPWWARGKRRSR